MGGLIKWLKKDGTQRMRRRESAPLQLFNKSRPSSEETYRESLIRFTKFRENERIKRLSMGANDTNGYHSVCNDQPDLMGEKTTPTDQRLIQMRPKTCPPKPYRSRNNANGRMDTSAHRHNGYHHHRTKKVSVQFHLSESTEESEMNYGSRSSSRHSMPAMTSNGYTRCARRAQNSIDSEIIREEDIEEFEGAHCKYSDSVNDDDQSSYRSPPSKFYKQNLNPFPSTSEASSLNTFGDMKPVLTKCPEKPKRLLHNSKQSRKLLTEAHFTGAYRNFEIQSPYYSDSSSVFSAVRKRNYASTDADSLTDDLSMPPNHYQVIVNKHGDEVEYALPCIDIAEYQKRQTLPNCLTSDDSILAGEVFNENPQDFDRILSENFEISSNVSISMNDEMQTHHQNHRDQHHNGRPVMITDLDKSNDSIATLNDSEINCTNELQANRIAYYHQVLSQQATIICSISDIESTGKMEAKLETPLQFEWGNFKTTDITVRRYSTPMNSNESDDYQLIVETAIIRDAEFLRKIRHRNVVNLMAIAFEPYHSLALIMEPTKYSLNHHVFVKNEQLTINEVVVVMRKMADAVQYMHECELCHSNISSHAILVGDNISQVKLSSFELAVPFKSDIQDDNELKSLHKSKYVPSIRQKNSPKTSLSFDQKIDRYKFLSKDPNTSDKSSLQLNYSVPFIREINTKYLPYCTEYRRKLSVFNYQAPELLSQADAFVFPTKHSDTYALTLLLWELLNQCIPFVIYDEAKLCEMLKTNYPLKYLPIVEEERCQRFHDILERGLKREPDTRITLDKLIQKFDAIEAETCREHEKTQNLMKCCCLKTQNGKIPNRPQDMPTDDAMEKMTPDKSSKLFSVYSSPKPSPVMALSANTTEKTISPLNNATNNTFYRSMLDFNKLLSPRRNTNDEPFQRSSTLKRRKKIGPTDVNKRNVKDLFGADNLSDDKQKTTVAGSPDSASNSSGRPSNEFNNALMKSAINRELECTNNEENSVIATAEKTPMKKIEQPFGPKEEIDRAESNGMKLANENSSYQFVIDDYELPQELIARNNKIRRCTWLSTDQVNSSMQYEPLSAVAPNVQAKQHNDIPTMPSLNESNDSGKQLNVSIKIIHTQLTPNENASSKQVKNRSHNESIKSDCSSMSGGTSSEESFSVKSRIKFFRSLESQPVQRRTPNKNKMSMSRRSEMSFNEAKRVIEKSQRHTYPSSNYPHINQQLMKDIVDLTTDIKNCLSKNKHLSDKKPDDTHMTNEKEINFLLRTDLNDADESVVMLRNILNENSKNETTNENAGEKRNSVRETVQKFELSLGNDKSNKSFPLRKIENKLLNEKILNTDFKFDSIKGKVIYMGNDNNKNDEVTDEKVEDVIRIESPPEAENEAGSHPIPEQEPENNEPQSQQTLIKRTFYQESIISGTNMEMPELKNLLVNSPNISSGYATTQKSSLTTRVTLNMRKCRRRASDVASIRTNRSANGFTSEAINAACLPDARHSICGSPVPIVGQNSEPNSGRMLEQISDETQPNAVSSLMVSNDRLRSSLSSVLAGNFNGKQIQSIEDLYIDDDFGGIGLAANMKLMTNSVDSLDNINFDIISTHIYEQMSESMLATNMTNTNENLNASKNEENGKAIDN